MDWYVNIKVWYQANPQLWNETMLQNAVLKKKITQAQADEIKESKEV